MLRRACTLGDTAKVLDIQRLTHSRPRSTQERRYSTRRVTSVLKAGVHSIAGSDINIVDALPEKLESLELELETNLSHQQHEKPSTEQQAQCPVTGVSALSSTCYRSLTVALISKTFPLKRQEIHQGNSSGLCLGVKLFRPAAWADAEAPARFASRELLQRNRLGYSERAMRNGGTTSAVIPCHWTPKPAFNFALHEKLRGRETQFCLSEATINRS